PSEPERLGQFQPVAPPAPAPPEPPPSPPAPQPPAPTPVAGTAPAPPASPMPAPPTPVPAQVTEPPAAPPVSPPVVAVDAASLESVRDPHRGDTPMTRTWRAAGFSALLAAAFAAPPTLADSDKGPKKDSEKLDESLKQLEKILTRLDGIEQ